VAEQVALTPAPLMPGYTETDQERWVAEPAKSTYRTHFERRTRKSELPVYRAEFQKTR